jgi:hypothetical protein
LVLAVLLAVLFIGCIVQKKKAHTPKGFQFPQLLQRDVVLFLNISFIKKLYITILLVWISRKDEVSIKIDIILAAKR